MKIYFILFISFILLLLLLNNSVYADLTSTNAASNITTLLEKKGLYIDIYTESKIRLNDIKRVYSLKQSEITMLESIYDTLSNEEKVKANAHMKKAQTQLLTITSLMDDLQFKIKSSNAAIIKTDTSISTILGGINPSIIRFAITIGDGLLMVKENSTIYGIGANPYGNLGCGNYINPITIPCKTIDTTFLKGKVIWQMKSQIHTTILTTDNTLITFGHGEFGSLGNGQFIHQSVPVLVDNSLFIDKQIKQMEVGYGTTIIMTNEGKLYGWGTNQYSELCFNGQKIASPTVIPTFGKKVKKVFYQMFTSVFLTEDGEVYFCGRGFTSTGQSYLGNKIDISVLDPTDPIEDIAILHASLVFRTRLGNLYSMGYNGHGSLGLGDTNDRTVPTLISSLKNAGTIITKICAGTRHVIALSSIGKVYQWGTPCVGITATAETLGTTTGLTVSNSPIRFIGNDIENYKIVDIFCGGASNIAISDNGVVFGWGKSQLFGPAGSSFATPTKLVLP